MTLCSDSTAVTALWPENYDFDSDGQKNGATGFSVFHWTVFAESAIGRVLKPIFFNADYF